MYRRFYSLALVVAAVCGSHVASAETTVSYARDVRPFLTRYCVECHHGHEPEGGLNLETYTAMLAGGEHGAALTPGNPDKSRIVRMVEGKARPAMPPKKSQ